MYAKTGINIDLLIDIWLSDLGSKRIDMNML